MTICRTGTCLMLLLALLLAIPPYGEAGRANPPREPLEFTATVVDLRRYELGTYLQVLREDGKYEWLEIPESDGMTVKIGQTVAYSTERSAHWNDSFGGMLRTGVNIWVPAPKRDDRIYRSKGRDGSLVFTDTPSQSSELPESGKNNVANHGKKKKEPQKRGKKPDEEVIIIDPEEVRRQEEFTEEYNRYLQDIYHSKPTRRAKRARPPQVNENNGGL